MPGSTAPRSTSATTERSSGPPTRASAAVADWYEVSLRPEGMLGEGLEVGDHPVAAEQARVAHGAAVAHDRERVEYRGPADQVDDGVRAGGQLGPRALGESVAFAHDRGDAAATQLGRLGSLREVATTRTPAARASSRQARPTDDVAPRTSSVCPLSRPSVASEPAAVMNVSGSAPSTSQASVVSSVISWSSGSSAYSGVAAVELPAHAAHDRRDRRAGHDRRALRDGLDDARALDAEDARERDVGARPATQRHVLGAIQPERLDAHERPARTGLGPRHLAHDERVRTLGSLCNGCPHRLHGGSLSSARARLGPGTAPNRLPRCR